jgi:general secretion pathway protein A
MYCNFYKFSEKPFDVTPDPKFLYLSLRHQELLASLIYGIRERRGFITIVGEVGTGKTTIIRTALDRLDESIRASYIFNSDVTFDEMLRAALIDLGVTGPRESLSKMEAISRLNDFAIQQLSAGGNVALIVDEAQNLDHRFMESLRLLSNLETHKRKLVQIVLSGQPELDAKLRQPELRQLAQRISLRRFITPLSKKETYGYIQHRLAIANYKDPSVFSQKAQQLIWEYSRGVPRKINILCDNAFLIGYGLKKKKILAPVMQEAIKDLTSSPFSGSIEVPEAIPMEKQTSESKAKTSHFRFSLAPSLLLIVCVIFAMGLYVDDSRLKLFRERLLLFYQKALVALSDKPSSAKQATSGLDSVYDQTEIGRESTSKSVQEEKVESYVNSIEEYSQRLNKSAKLQSETNKEEASKRPETVSGDWEKALGKQQWVTVVKEGDSLSGIIMQRYGKYDERILSTVLRENPEILSPDRIRAGKTIKLPELNFDRTLK